MSCVVKFRQNTLVKIKERWLFQLNINKHVVSQVTAEVLPAPKHNHKKFNNAAVTTGGYCIVRF